jgi:hypothetical protein
MFTNQHLPVMKNTLFCTLLLALALLSACNKESPTEEEPDCCPITCWGQGMLDSLDCNCQCNPGFGGTECDSLLFQQGSGLRFDAYKVDYMETAAPGDLMEINCRKYIRKGSDAFRQFRFTNVAGGPVLIKTATSTAFPLP